MGPFVTLIMSLDTEARATNHSAAAAQSSPTVRQTGFAVPLASTPTTQDFHANAIAAVPKMRSSNASLDAALQGRSNFVTKGATSRPIDDGDADMAEAAPLPIPTSHVKTEPVVVLNNASHSPNDIPTPPDTLCVAPNKGTQSPHAANMRLPSLSSSMLSPRFSNTQGSSVSSGPTSVSSSNWSSGGKSTDPHLYSISAGRKYSYNSFKPAMSTSFKTSAMRMRGSAYNDEEDEEDDSFGGKASSSHGAAKRESHRGVELDGDEMFAFSSPCFGPKELADDNVPSPELHEALPPSQASLGAQNVLSPSWATASLGKLSLGASESRASPASSSNRRPSRSQNFHGAGPLSSSADVAAAAMKQRRYSYSKHSRPPFAQNGSSSSYLYSSSYGRDHPYARTPTSSSWTSNNRATSRSRSRTRPEASTGTAVVDDDETDEEMRMENDEDDDATEDEAEPSYRRYGSSYQERNGLGSLPRAEARGRPADVSRGSTPSSYGANPASLGLTFQMSPGRTSNLAKGHPLDVHRSPVPSNLTGPVSLSRQYSSDRHAVGSNLAPLRHHPYATSPSGTTGPLSASMGLAYSPGSNAPLQRPVHRRGSSLNNGLAAPAYAAGILSTSPRFANATAIPRSNEMSGSYGSEEGGDLSGQSPYGAGSPLSTSQRRNGSGNYYTPAAQGSQYSQSPRYAPQGFAARKETNGFAISLPSHYEGHERSESMASEATEVGDAARKVKVAPSAGVGPRSNSNTGASGNVDETAQVAAIRDRLGGAASCSAFISKLWHLMINPTHYAKYIHWDEAGSSIILSSEPEIANEFAADVLPRLFKHGNNASFIRQLNLYGFQRIPSSRLLDPAEMKVALAKKAESGGAGNGSTTLNTAVQLYGAHSSFSHPRFRRDHEELLPTMKPRSSKKPKKSAAGGAPADTSLGADETDEEDFAL